MQSLTNTLILLVGAVVMTFCAFRLNGMFKTLQYVPGRGRAVLGHFLKVQRLLLLLVLAGFVKTAISFVFKTQAIGTAFIGALFLFGAVTILHGIVMQSRMVSLLEETIQGLLKLCAYCKKVRVLDEEGKECWQPLDVFISIKTAADFSHGVCPECREVQEQKARE